MHVNSLVNPRSEPLVYFTKAFAAMAVRTSGSEWWTPVRWRVGIEIDPSPTLVKTLRVLLELESLESTLESQKKTPTHFAPGTDFSRMRIDFSKMAAYNTCQRKFQFWVYSTDEFGMSKDRFDFPLIC